MYKRQGDDGGGGAVGVEPRGGDATDVIGRRGQDPAAVGVDHRGAVADEVGDESAAPLAGRALRAVDVGDGAQDAGDGPPRDADRRRVAGGFAEGHGALEHIEGALALAATGRFTLIERVLLKHVFEEQELQSSHLTDESTLAAEAGLRELDILLSVDRMPVADLSTLAGAYERTSGAATGKRTVLLEILSLAATCGPMAFHFDPIIGGSLYWWQNDTLRVPPPSARCRSFVT